MFEHRNDPETNALFLQELSAHCQRLNQHEFDFSVEAWGIWQMPCFIYIDGESQAFSMHLSSADIKDFEQEGIFELIKKHEVNYDLEIARTTYKLVIADK